MPLWVAYARNKRYWIGMSVRKIPKNYRNVTGLGSHRKADGRASFESTLERDFLTLLEFSPEVDCFEVQPVAVEWIDGLGLQRRYTPDVLIHYVRTSQRPPMLVEVKYRSELKAAWSDLRPRFKAGVRYAREHGWRFKIMTEVEIRTPYLQNARFLLPFVSRGPGTEAYMELLDEALKKLKRATPRALLEAIYQDDMNQAKLLPTLWYLIGIFNVGADLALPLNMNTPIWYRP